jgi:hypothetical protein
MKTTGKTINIPKLEISLEERAENKLTPESVDAGVRLLREAGLVVIESVLPCDWIAELNIAMQAVMDNENEDDNQNGENPMLKMPFMDPRIIDSPFAMPIMKAAMGEKIFAYLPYGCNATVPGSDTQWIHRDSGQLFPELPFALPVSTIVVNIPLVDFTVENGATEVWPGSHLIIDDPAVRNSPYNVCQEERAAQHASFQLEMPAGSVVVRDMRCWHRAMPNRTQIVRPMLALVYFRRLHHSPDAPGIFSRRIPEEIWTNMSEEAQEVYRFQTHD